MREGKGMMFYVKNVLREGWFINGNLNGLVRSIINNGDVYIDQFKNNKIHENEKYIE